MTDPLGQSQVLPYLEGLSKHDFRFTLISFEKPERFESNRSHIEEICKTANIRWIPLQYTKTPPVISTIKDLRKMRQLVLKLHKEHAFQLIHCRSYLTALVGLFMKRKKNVPFLFDMRGFWADERIEGGIWNIQKPVYKFIYNFFKKKEKQFLTESDGIVSLTYAGKETLLSWNLPQVSQEKIQVIPCCVDTNKFDPNKVDHQLAQDWREKYRLKGCYIVGYVGSIGTWYLLNEMLICFQSILKTKPHAVFLFITQESPEIIYKEAAKLSLTHEHIRVFSVSHYEVPTALSLFDCAVFFIQPSFSKTASSPTKQAELMAMGIPIVCNSGVGDTARMIEKNHAGQVVNDLSIQELQKFQLNLELFDQKQSQTAAQNDFGLIHGVASYMRMYLKLLDSKTC